MGIFCVQHWRNIVKLLTTIEQACLFLKEIEKIGSFMCWIAQVVYFPYKLLLTSDTTIVLRWYWQCCLSQMTILVLENYRYTCKPVVQRTAAGDRRSDSDRIRRGTAISRCMSLCFPYIMSAQCCMRWKSSGTVLLARQQALAVPWLCTMWRGQTGATFPVLHLISLSFARSLGGCHKSRLKLLQSCDCWEPSFRGSRVPSFIW